MEARKIFYDQVELFSSKALSDEEIENEIESLIKLNVIGLWSQFHKEPMFQFLKKNPFIFKAMHHSPNLDLVLKLKLGIGFDLYGPRLSTYEFVSKIIFLLRLTYLKNTGKNVAISLTDSKFAALLCDEITQKLKITCYHQIEPLSNLNSQLINELEEQATHFLPQFYLSSTIVQDFFIANVMAESLKLLGENFKKTLEKHMSNPAFEFRIFLLAGMLDKKQFQLLFNILLTNSKPNIESIKFLLHTWSESQFKELSSEQYKTLFQLVQEVLKNKEQKKIWDKELSYFKSIIPSETSFGPIPVLHSDLLYLIQNKITKDEHDLLYGSKWNNDIMILEALKRGANINVQDSEGRTVLHRLAAINPVEYSYLPPPNYNLLVNLLQKGADPSIKDNKGLMASDIASDEFFKKLLQPKEKRSPHIANNLFPVNNTADLQHPKLTKSRSLPDLSTNKDWHVTQRKFS